MPAPAFAATSPPVMKGRSFRVLVFSVLALASGAARAQQDAENLEVRISIADQKLVVLRDGMWTQRFDVSTSKFGSGDSFGSYKTPLGRLRVCSKIGGGLPSGAVMNHRNATGEVLPVNARGRDPIAGTCRGGVTDLPRSRWGDAPPASALHTRAGARHGSSPTRYLRRGGIGKDDHRRSHPR